VFLLNFSNLSEQVFEASRQEPPRFLRLLRPLDREGLAAACLAISKNASVVSVQTLVDYTAAHLFENLGLGCLLAGYIIECEDFS
jgi:hypothetical protein